MRTRLLSSAYGLLAIISLWYLASVFIGPDLIPWPHAVAPVFWNLIVSGGLLKHAAVSLFRLIAALAGSLIIGVPLGILAGVSPRGDRLISPIVYILYPLPKIAFLPVFILLFGLGNLSKVLLLLSVIVFQLILASRDGVKEITSELQLAVKILNLRRRERFFRIYIPATLPRLFSALRISVGIGMAVLFFAENYATTWGLGYFVMNAWVMIDYPVMFAGIIGLGLSAAAVLLSVDFLYRLSCPWVGETSNTGLESAGRQTQKGYTH